MKIVNGWALYTLPSFADQIDKLASVVEKLREKTPTAIDRPRTPNCLRQCATLMCEIIPIDPARPEFRQGGTLRPSRKHWFRARFGKVRFRFFFRYSSSGKIIINTRGNDSNSLCNFGSSRMHMPFSGACSLRVIRPRIGVR